MGRGSQHCTQCCQHTRKKEHLSREFVQGSIKFSADRVGPESEYSDAFAIKSITLNIELFATWENSKRIAPRFQWTESLSACKFDRDTCMAYEKDQE